jgi:hypothetical protein
MHSEKVRALVYWVFNSRRSARVADKDVYREFFYRLIVSRQTFSRRLTSGLTLRDESPSFDQSLVTSDAVLWIPSDALTMRYE